MDGGERAAVLGADEAAALWEAVAAPAQQLGGPFAAYRVGLPPAHVGGVLEAVSALGGDLLLRASAGSGIVYVTLPDADRNRALLVAQHLAQAAEAVGGWVASDTPGGLARHVLPARQPDRISAGIKAEFDPAGVLPPLP